jgi:hypothetical protein
LVLRVRARVDFLVHLGDLSVFVDHVRDPLRVLVLRTARRAVSDADLAIGVAKKREGKVELLGEPGVVRDRVKTDAKDLRVFLLVLIGEVPEPGTFRRSTGCIGLRIEPQHDFLAAIVAQPRAMPAMIADFEIGRRVADLQHWRTSCDVLPDKAHRAGE